MLSLFSREDSAEAQWRIVDPILNSNTPIHYYDALTWGPRLADDIAQGSGAWHDPARAEQKMHRVTARQAQKRA